MSVELVMPVSRWHLLRQHIAVEDALRGGRRRAATDRGGDGTYRSGRHALRAAAAGRGDDRHRRQRRKRGSATYVRSPPALRDTGTVIWMAAGMSMLSSTSTDVINV